MIAERSPRPVTGPRADPRLVCYGEQRRRRPRERELQALTDNCGGNRPDRRVVAAQKASAKNGSGPLAQW
jgi:hypothetical protein